MINNPTINKRITIGRSHHALRTRKKDQTSPSIDLFRAISAEHTIRLNSFLKHRSIPEEEEEVHQQRSHALSHSDVHQSPERENQKHQKIQKASSLHHPAHQKDR